MGSLASEDPKLMSVVMKAIKQKNLIFIDSKTSTKSVAYEVANSQGLICGYNEGFIDSVNGYEEMAKRLDRLVASAEKRGAVIAIAHPKKATIDFLKTKITEVTQRVDFITIKEYFDR